MARSGSKFLKNLLNKHPCIDDAGEIFHNKKETFVDENSLVACLGGVLLNPAPRSGFQFRYPRHFKEFPEIVSLLEKNKDQIDVLFLMRKNKLKGAISQQNAELIKRNTGKAHLFTDSDRRQSDRLVLDVDRALKETLDREKKDKEYLEWAETSFNTHVMYYEDLCKDSGFEIAKFLEFLGVPNFKPGTSLESELVKITSEDLQDAIENYNELEAGLEKIERLEYLGKKKNQS